MLLLAFFLLCAHVCRSFPNEVCVRQWDCKEACRGRPSTLCCRASHLTERLHDLDTYPHQRPQDKSETINFNEFKNELWKFQDGLKFAEPTDVHQLCLDFLRFPKGSIFMEQHLTRCSRAMLNMAVMADVALHQGQLGSNKTCSEVSLKARYPMKPEDEQFYKDLAMHRFWPSYLRWYHLMVSRWKVFAMLANHTAICTGLGYQCAAFNPWEPERCFAHHELIRAWSPSCHEKPKTPTRPPTLATDWLGVRHKCGTGSMPEPQVQPELTRQLECWGLPWGPVPGEDYFETISLLQALSRLGRSGEFPEFVHVEVGSSIGFWSLKAAKAFRRQFGKKGSCTVILIESDCPKRKIVEHLRENNIYDLCNISIFEEHLDLSKSSILARKARSDHSNDYSKPIYNYKDYKGDFSKYSNEYSTTV